VIDHDGRGIVPSIFVATSALNEDELFNTVQSAYEMAQKPFRVYFGIAEQRIGDNNYAEFPHFSRKVKKIDIGYPMPAGLQYGRLSALMLHEHQDYVLQIDAHTVFQKNWDEALISQIIPLEKRHKKSLISCRPKHYRIDNYGNREFFNTAGQNGLCIKSDAPGFVIDSIDFPQSTAKDHRQHFLVAGGFIFAPMALFLELLPDPRISFSGEEQVFALRACTRGWKIFTTGNSCLYTLGKTEHTFTDVDTRVTGTRPWKSLNTKTLSNGEACIEFHIPIDMPGSYVNNILTGKTLGYWGAPDEATYEKYICELGFDYRTGKPC